MKPRAFAYHAPVDMDEVVATLGMYAGEARVLAGGQSLVPMLNLRLSSPEALVDLQRVPDLRGVEVVDNHILVGAMTTHSTALKEARIRRHLPLLAEALRWVGHEAIRNAGTMGGSIAHSDPAAELPLILMLLDGEVVAHGPSGRRVVGAADFIAGYYSNALADDEVVVSVRWPVPGLASDRRWGWGFREVARRHGDFCLASVAASIEFDQRGVVRAARLAAGGVADRPLRLPAAEALLVGEEPTEEVLRAAASADLNTIRPSSDMHASSDYRRHLVGVLTLRALNDSVRRGTEKAAA